jgi:DNA processing protein
MQYEIKFDEPHFPLKLRQIACPPQKIFALGDISLLNRPQIALVGTRNPTPKGLAKAKYFARELNAMGVVVTSGMSVGIETAAHIGSLQYGGKTISVQPCGFDKVYPVSNLRLWHQIVKHGCLLSEFGAGEKLAKQHFLHRNRIISGLTLGVLVVEATLECTALIIAKCAMEQGREVFAIPDAIDNDKARGCHYLIKQGAKLVENIDDIMIELENTINYKVGEWQNI